MWLFQHRNRYSVRLYFADMLILEPRVSCLLQLFSVYFLTDSAEDCNCWSVPIQGYYHFFDIDSYPQCRRLAERVCSGTCDCTNTQYGRLVWVTSLHLACYYGQLEMVKYLMRFCQIAQERTFFTPLVVSFVITSR